MAKTGLIVIGSILIVLAGTGYVIPVTDEGYTIVGFNNWCQSDLGQFGQSFSGDTQQTCGMYQLMMYGIIGAGLIGIILIIAGAVVPSKGVKPLTCPFCNYAATSASELHNHSLNCEKRNKETPKKKNEALDILKERYAKGEITKEEFDKMKEDLS